MLSLCCLKPNLVFFFFIGRLSVYVYIFKHTLLCVHVSTRFLSNQFHSLVINAVI